MRPWAGGLENVIDISPFHQKYGPIQSLGLYLCMYTEYEVLWQITFSSFDMPATGLVTESPVGN